MKHNLLSHLPRTRSVLLAIAHFGAITVIRAAETPPKPLFPGIATVCACESLTQVSLPNTTIESAGIEASNGWCRVTAIVTHPPAGDRVKVFIGLPVTNWNGRFQGNGGGGFSGVDHGFRGAGPAPTGLMAAIVRWVEEGKAPAKLIAEKRDSSGKVIRTRPLFPFPKVARYKGTGSTDDVANFEGRTPTPNPL